MLYVFLCVLTFQEVPHGVLCFVPSYTTLSKLKTRWEVSKQYPSLSLSLFLSLSHFLITTSF